MSIVIDASALGAFLLGDHPIEALEIIESTIALGVGEAPSHWPVEVMNLIVKAGRQRRLNTELVLPLWRQASEVIALSRVHALKVDDELLSLANNTGLTPRDASYVELAERLGAPLLTVDHAMIRVARDRGMSLVIDIP